MFGSVQNSQILPEKDSLHMQVPFPLIPSKHYGESHSQHKNCKGYHRPVHYRCKDWHDSLDKEDNQFHRNHHNIAVPITPSLHNKTLAMILVTYCHIPCASSATVEKETAQKYTLHKTHQLQLCWQWSRSTYSSSESCWASGKSETTSTVSLVDW